MSDIISSLETYFSRANAWSPLWLTMKTGVVATVFSFFFGVFIARKVMKMEKLAQNIEYIELSTLPGYEKQFSQCLIF